MVEEMSRNNISNLHRKQKIYRYVIPIQSARQMALAIVHLLAMAAIFFLLMKSFALLFDRPGVTMLGAFIFSTLMVYCTLFTLLSTDFTTAALVGERPPILETVDSELRALGYEPISVDETDGRHYRRKGANRLHWEEDDFHITLESEKMTVRGPLLTNWKLRNCLLKCSTTWG